MTRKINVGDGITQADFDFSDNFLNIKPITSGN